METEYNIAGRILSDSGTRPVSLAEVLASPYAAGAVGAAGLSEESLVSFCKSLSAQNACRVYVWKDCEEYGNANVFNGGSDYEVVNEECFLCICDCGREVLCERTDCWNAKIDSVL